jgi:predicted RNase H-like HicB family nuclease
MDAYEVELEAGEPDRVAAVVPALPGLLLLGKDVDEVLERARAAIAYHVGSGSLTAQLIVIRLERGEQFHQAPGLRRGQGHAHARELVSDRPGVA